MEGKKTRQTIWTNKKEKNSMEKLQLNIAIMKRVII